MDFRRLTNGFRPNAPDALLVYRAATLHGPGAISGIPEMRLGNFVAILGNGLVADPAPARDDIHEDVG